MKHSVVVEHIGVVDWDVMNSRNTLAFLTATGASGSSAPDSYHESGSIDNSGIFQSHGDVLPSLTMKGLLHDSKNALAHQI